jgi:hypothetical protein
MELVCARMASAIPFARITASCPGTNRGCSVSGRTYMANTSAKVTVMVAIIGVAGTIAAAVITNWDRITGRIEPPVHTSPGGPGPSSTLPASPSAPPSQTPSCEIAGHVYNSDDNKPLAGIRVFARNGTRAEGWLPLASSGPDGSFQGSCVRFDQTAFPLHLGVTDDQWRCTPADPPFSADGWETVQQSGAPNVNLFVSVKGMIHLKIIACRPN